MLETAVFLMGEAGYASEHDQKVARWAGYILCGERKTQERIAFTLKTGKPLRN